MELTSNQKDLLATICYSDIFDYPLTLEELYRNFIAPQRISKTTINKTAHSLANIITYKNGYYCLKGREQIIGKRQERAMIAKGKLKIAGNVARYLSLIPTVLFIGATGSLSHRNCDADDDIDMFFITKKNSLWTTRFLILLVLELLQVRRTPEDTNPRNKICPNLIIDETAIIWPSGMRDIYTSHEIVSVHPLFERRGMYQKFLKSNAWIKQFFPNKATNPSRKNYKEPKQHFFLISLVFILSLPLIEAILSKAQKRHMRSKITTEIIQPNFLAFHPQDKRSQILRAFAARKRRLLEAISTIGFIDKHTNTNYTGQDFITHL